MEELRAVLCGCGSMSGTWLRAAGEIPGLRMVGLVDVREEAAHSRREEFGLAGARVGTELAPLLQELQPDLVFDCTVPEAHREVTLTALAHGCHVLGEKPLAESLESAGEMVSAAENSGRLYAVMQNRRYDLRARRMRAFLASGALGPLTTLHSDFYIGAHFGGFRDQMEHPLLLDMAIHTFDMARHLTGADPVSVQALEWNPEGSWYVGQASAVAVFRMTGGLVYTYRGSWCAEGLNTSWEAEWRGIGARGSVWWDGGETYRAERVSGDEGFRRPLEPVEVPPTPHDARDGGHQGCIQEFVECVRSGGVPETHCADNLKSLAMVFGAIESARLGREVSITSLLSG